MSHEVKAALRALRARPRTTVLAALCLGLGVGANMGLYGIVDVLLFRPPAGVERPEELVRIRVGAAPSSALVRGAGVSMTYPRYEDIRRERTSLLSGMLAYAPRSGTLDGGAGARKLDLVFASGSYFEVLGVRMQRGRAFGAAEDGGGADPAVAVLSDAFWRGPLAAAEDVVGRTIRVNGMPVVVVGVAPAGFHGVDLGAPDVWVPIALAATEAFGGPRQLSNAVYWLQSAGRVRPGVPRAQAMAVVAAENVVVPYATPAPGVGYPEDAPVPITLSPLTTMFFAAQRGGNPVSLWMLGISAAVLLLTCATVANLLLVEASRRAREASIRLALGARPAGLVRQFLWEGAGIAVLAAACALVFARLTVQLARALPIPPVDGVLNGGVLGLAAGIALATTLLFALAPAWWLARREVSDLLRAAGSGSVTAVTRGPRALAAGQVAISFLLLLAAGLFLHSIRRFGDIDVGFALDDLLEIRFDLRSGGATAERAVAALDEAAARVRALPGVANAGFAYIVPFYLYARGRFSIGDGRADAEQPTSVLVNTVDDAFFETFGIGAAAGRVLDARDRASSPPVAVVSERLAREYWPRGDAIGACISIRTTGDADCARIVGIARAARYSDLAGDDGPGDAVLYIPAAQTPSGVRGLTLFVRVEGGAARAADAVRRAVNGVDPSLPYAEVSPLAARTRPARMQWEVSARLFTAFGVLAAALSAIGLATIVGLTVAQRRRELAIRMAVGARPRDIVRLVVAHGLALGATGIAAGTLLGLASARLLASMLFRTSALDPAIYLATATFLLLIALVAGQIPARRAARIDPLQAMRQD